MERRRFKRVPQTLPIRIYVGDVEQISEHETTDISEGGLFIRMKAPPKDGAFVDLEFRLDGAPAPIRARGRIVRSLLHQVIDGSPPGFGVQFTRLASESRSRIRTVIERYNHERHSQVIELPQGFLDDVDEQIRSVLEEQKPPARIDLEIRVRFPEEENFTGALAHTLASDEIFIQSGTLWPMGTTVKLQVLVDGDDNWVFGEGAITKAVYSSGTAGTPPGPGLAVTLSPSSEKLCNTIASIAARAQNLPI